MLLIYVVGAVVVRGVVREYSSLSRSLLLILTILFSSVAFADYAPMGISGVRTVNVFQAKALYDAGAIFVDVRNDEEWKMGHISGALHLDFQRDFEKLYKAQDVKRSTPLVIYCSSAECMRSAYASAVSVYWGFSNVYYFRTGFFAWMLEDFPVIMQMTAMHDKKLLVTSD
jgi:rhodanese-related sulfurtransferase